MFPVSFGIYVNGKYVFKNECGFDRKFYYCGNEPQIGCKCAINGKPGDKEHIDGFSKWKHNCFRADLFPHGG